MRVDGLANESTKPQPPKPNHSPQNPPPPDFGVSDHGLGHKMTPRDFLAQRIPGPYTCLRARNNALLGFDFHLTRLLHSIRCVAMLVGGI